MSDGFTGLFQLLVKTNKMHNYVLPKYIHDFRNFDEFFHAIARECFEVFLTVLPSMYFPAQYREKLPMKIAYFLHVPIEQQFNKIAKAS